MAMVHLFSRIESGTASSERTQSEILANMFYIFQNFFEQFFLISALFPASFVPTQPN